MPVSNPFVRSTMAAVVMGVPVLALAVSLEPNQTLSEDTSYQVAAVDADNDGDLDLVFGQYNDYVELWLNDGTGQFANSGMDIGNNYTSSLYVVDADGNASPDLFVGGASAYKEMSAQILVNNGSGTFTEDAAVTVSGEEAGDWSVADVDEDGHLDLIALTHDGFITSNSTLSIWYGSDTGYPATPDEHSIYEYKCASVEAADLAGDGGAEVVVGCAPYNGDGTEFAGGIQVWQHDGSALTNLTSVLETDWDIGDIDFTDIDGDGHLDIVGTHYNSSTPVSVTSNDHSVWINNNDGTFSAAALDFNGISLEIADIDGDGRDDLIIADGSNVRLHLGESGTGFAYQAGAVETCSAYVQAVAAGDLNGDAKTDLALAGTPYYTSTDPADLVVMQDGTNGICADSGTGGGGSGSDDGGDSSDSGDDSGDSDGASGGGGALGTGLLLILGLLSVIRIQRD